MATKNTTEQTIINPAAPQQPKIIWDDSKMNTSYANVCNVVGTKEEVFASWSSQRRRTPRADRKSVV